MTNKVKLFILLGFSAFTMIGCMEDVQPEDTEPDETAQEDVRLIQVEWYDRNFDPDEIEVEEWETIEFEFTSTGWTHNFYIPELDKWTEMMEEWETDSIVVIFEEEWEYEFICTRWDHAKEWMTGMIIVH